MKYLLLSFLIVLPSIFASTCPTGYNEKNRVYDSSVSPCPNGTLTTTDVKSSNDNTVDVCRCTKCSQIEVWMAAEGEVCDDGTWLETPTQQEKCSDYPCPQEWGAKSTELNTNCVTLECTVNDKDTCCEYLFDTGTDCDGQCKTGYYDTGLAFVLPDTWRGYSDNANPICTLKSTYSTSPVSYECHKCKACINDVAKSSFAYKKNEDDTNGYKSGCGDWCKASFEGQQGPGVTDNYRLDTSRKNQVCTWKGCRGCKKCKDWKSTSKCSAFRCPADKGFFPKENSELIDCASDPCDKSDIMTCCESDDIYYKRDRTNLPNCHECTNGCLNGNTVAQPCLCKESDTNIVMAMETNERCDSDGYPDASDTTDVELFGLKYKCNPSCEVLYTANIPDRRRLRTTRMLNYKDSDHSYSTEANDVCVDRKYMDNAQTKECSGCIKCMDDAEDYDFSYRAELRLETHKGRGVGMGCRPWCKGSFEGTAFGISTKGFSDEVRKNKVCGWVACQGCKACKDWSVNPSKNDLWSNKAFEYVNGGYINACEGWCQSTYNSKGGKVCMWATCSGCTKCKIETSDSNIKMAIKLNTVDLHGDGTELVGMCHMWCRKGWEAANGNTVEQDKVCTWQKNGIDICRGCRGCQERAEDDTNNNGFAYKVPNQQLEFKRSYGRKKNLKVVPMSKGCEKTCRTLWNAVGTDAEQENICAKDECSGCKKCSDLEASIVDDTNTKGKYDSSRKNNFALITPSRTNSGCAGPISCNANKCNAKKCKGCVGC